jgi:ribosomal protein L24E
MGHGYKGNTGHYHAITENVASLKSEYLYSNGYFGEKGAGRVFVRNIKSDDPAKTAKNFYDTAARGGIEHQMSNGKGIYTKMRDGTILSFREVSSSDGSPAVEINIKQSTDNGGLKYQKIHFTKG